MRRPEELTLLFPDDVDIPMSEPAEQFDRLIRTFVPINALPQDPQSELIRASEVISVRKGKFVFNEGDTDDFSYYLLEGTLTLSSGGQLVKDIAGRTEAAKAALAQLQPRQLSAKAKTTARVLRVDRPLLQRLLSIHDPSHNAPSEMEVSDIGGEASFDWMTRMLQSELFARIPAANIQNIFARMEGVEVPAGEVVVEQGSPGDFYYVIQHGRCTVSRRASGNGQEIKLAELGPGDSFGEEALVSESHRNATVTMLQAGELMRLTKSDFIELIKAPALKGVDRAEAKLRLGQGARILDVRFPEERVGSELNDSVNIPINVLRMQAESLAKDVEYVAVCDNGERSSAAAFLLVQLGLDVVFLETGLRRGKQSSATSGESANEDRTADAVPTDANKEVCAEPDCSADEATPQPNVAAPRAKRAEFNPADTLSPVLAASILAEVQPEAQEVPAHVAVEAEIRATALDAELEKAKLELDSALKAKATAETKLQSSDKFVAARLKAEREELKKQASEASNALQAAQRLKQEAADAQRRAEREAAEIQDAAAKRLARLEAERAEADAEVSRKLDEAVRQKAEAEERQRAAEREHNEELERERKRAESEALRASSALGEAKRLKEEAEAERRKAEEQSKHAHATADEIKRLREEREAHEAEVSARLERALEETAAAEARQRETEERIAREAKQEHEALLAEVQRANEALEEVNALKEEAAQAKQRAESQAAEIEAQRNAEIERLHEERIRADREVNERLEAAMAAKAEAEQARQEAEAKAAERIEQEAKERQRESERAANALREAQQLKLEIEKAKREAEAEVSKNRALQEARIREIEAQAEERLKDNEAKLEAEYAKNAEELAGIQKMREEMEASLETERQRLEREHAEAQEQKDAAERMNAEMAKARSELDKQAQRQRVLQKKLEQKLQRELQERLAQERLKLEREFAESTAELQRAEEERAAAEAARLAAQAEADRVVAEGRAAHVAAEEERLEREQAQAMALERELEAKLAAVEAKVNQADVDYTEAMRVREAVEEERARKAQEYKRTAAEQERLRLELEAEAQQWLAGVGMADEASSKGVAVEPNTMRRIKDSANAAVAQIHHNSPEDASGSLLEEVEAQLSWGQ